jgi:hypothetical protein
MTDEINELDKYQAMELSNQASIKPEVSVLTPNSEPESLKPGKNVDQSPDVELVTSKDENSNKEIKSKKKKSTKKKK